ncbi:MAG: hypothetical protein OEV35_10470 [Gallionellaceae bacterium]|nr:hypothetical protein [Gallionellaceae bacterium]
MRLLLLLTLIVTGCSSLEKLALDKPVETTSDPIQTRKKVAEAKRVCTKKYGYLIGSMAYEKCMEDNAPGLEEEVKKTVKMDEISISAKAQCERQGHATGSDEFYECFSLAMEKSSRTPQKKERSQPSTAF